MKILLRDLNAKMGKKIFSVKKRNKILHGNVNGRPKRVCNIKICHIKNPVVPSTMFPQLRIHKRNLTPSDKQSGLSPPDRRKTTIMYTSSPIFKHLTVLLTSVWWLQN